MNYFLFCGPLFLQISSNQYHSTIGEANCNLSQVLQHSKGGDLEALRNEYLAWISHRKSQNLQDKSFHHAES